MISMDERDYSMSIEEDKITNDNIDYDSMEVKLDPILEEFLDADSYEEKLGIFYKLRNTEDKELLRMVAISLEIEVTKESPEEMYDEILYCLRTMERFECNRLRS